MKLMEKRLGVAGRFYMHAERHGNTIAASIPLGLHEAITRGEVQRGDHLLLLGTSAGLSLGGLVLEY
ncbi:3-oxoacyl-[acyl-carrier-protein] synthase 3 [compost metagenome]